MKSKFCIYVVATFVLFALLCISNTLLVASEFTYNRDIRPILAAKCFACHGPDEESREADLRLDTFAGATVDLGGYRAIVPKHSRMSALIERVTSDDEELRMPPKESGKTLTESEIAKLRQWIDDGADYKQHWAFVPPKKQQLPKVQDKRWPINPIDHFILQQIEASGLKPSATADKYALVRRLYLDLIGIPPTPAEADEFVNDTSATAYEKLVDRLLKSKHYGERWARLWLDLARYSDTNGYEKDRQRSIWPYRDWVIQALNDDMPFDQFTIEQVAGDMLLNPTPAQQIATGFHRNTMLNEEGGIDPLEYRFYAMVDRVATTGTAWLGLTTGCAQCHSHKYDPISHTDYYQLMALLNNADEPDLQVFPEGTEEQRRTIESRIADRESELMVDVDTTSDDYKRWLSQITGGARKWWTPKPDTMTTNLPRLEVLEDGSIFSTGDITKRDVFNLSFDTSEIVAPITALRLEVLPDDRLPAGGPGRCYYEGRKGDFFLSEVIASSGSGELKFAGGSHTYGKISIGSGKATAENLFDRNGSTGWSTSGQEGKANHIVLNFAEPVSAKKLDLEFLFERHFAASLGRFRISFATVADAKANKLATDIEVILATPQNKRTDEQQQSLVRHFVLTHPSFAKRREPLGNLKKSLPAAAISMVMLERPADNPRPTFRHHRGEYLKPREEVRGGIPAFLAPLSKNQPKNRLEFARWLVSDGNPLVGRVTANRAWRAFFGHGLMRTSGDFGTQSEAPTHPELLDWLACQFVEDGWSLKKLHRLIVTSAAYRQSSRFSESLLTKDPHNRLFARQTRFRLDGEVVRDHVLASSGLLSKIMGGPSVYPPQPASVTSLGYGNFRWTVSSGENRYRRSLYTFNRRTSPFAAYTVFDGPSGEICVPRRNRSNTPLQALTLLNDEMYLENARSLAHQADAIEGNVEASIFVFRRLLTRPPTSTELKLIKQYFDKQLQRLETKELDAAALTKSKVATNRQAALMLLARAVMNTDELVTR
jgi:cytochrome c553